MSLTEILFCPLDRGRANRSLEVEEAEGEREGNVTVFCLPFVFHRTSAFPIMAFPNPEPGMDLTVFFLLKFSQSTVVDLDLEGVDTQKELPNPKDGESRFSFMMADGFSKQRFSE